MWTLILLFAILLVLAAACAFYKALAPVTTKTAPKRKRYVCGFAFHSPGNERPRVVLLRKEKPAWQRGRLNGVGGKIEAGECAQEAMAREFKEEAGVNIPAASWTVFARMLFPDAEVVFLRTEHAAAENAETQTVWSDEANAFITEKIEHRLVRGIDEIADHHIMPNLRWAIPLAFHYEGEREIVTVEYKEHN